MDTLKASHDRGFSPDISATLSIGSERFRVGALGPEDIILQDARPTKPGHAVVHMVVDGLSTVYHVELTDGIDPSRLRQPIISSQPSREREAVA